MPTTEAVEEEIEITNLDLIVEIVDDTLLLLSGRSIVSATEMIDIFLDIRQLACEDRDLETVA
jgi:hypothetical protein